MKQNQEKNFFQTLFEKYSKATFIFCLIAIMFSIVAIGSVGSFGSIGKSYTVSGKSVIIELEFTDKQSSLDSVYFNLGAIGVKAGDSANLEIKYGVDSTTFYSSRLGKVKVANIYDGYEDKNSSSAVFTNVNYNWVCLYKNKEISNTYKYIKIEAPTNSANENIDIEINELAFISEDGDLISAKISKGDKGAEAIIDSQASFASRLGNYVELTESKDGTKTVTHKIVSSFFTITQSEAYTLSQISNIRGGSAINADNVYTIDTEFNALGSLFVMLGVSIFGVSAFGVRIIPTLFAIGILIFIFMLGKSLFKNDWFALVFAFLYAICGLSLTVARLGAPYSIPVFFVLASVYFMYKFYQKGISQNNPVLSAFLSVGLSGIMFAFGFAVDSKCVYSLIILAVIFVMAMFRQLKAYKVKEKKLYTALEITNANAKQEAIKDQNVIETERKVAFEANTLSYKNRLVGAWAIIFFLILPIALILLSAIPTYFSYVKYYNNSSVQTMSFLDAVIKGVTACFNPSNTTYYTATNIVTPFAWFFSVKGATIFNASYINANGTSMFLGVNASLNIAMSITALVGLLVSSFYVFSFKMFKTSSVEILKQRRIITRAYIVLLGGVLAGLLPYLFSGSWSAVNSLMFSVFYLGFIPLMIIIYMAYSKVGIAKKNAIEVESEKKKLEKPVIALIVLLSFFSLIFILSTPMYFGFRIAEVAANIMFGWTTMINNGYYMTKLK